MSDSVQLGPFELMERIGKGGMGAVFGARHEETGEPVAIKVLLAERAREPRGRRRFRREVQALAKLHHPAIAAILDFGEIDVRNAARGPDAFVEGSPWFAMEHVEGASLTSVAGGWQWEQFESFLLTTLDALAHAHARSIIHRDLKPSNIIVEDSETSAPSIDLVDFGVARMFESPGVDANQRSEGVSGTPKYMAPEQILGRIRDEGPWTDLYALGCLTWRLMCESAPFTGLSTREVLEAHIHDSPPDFRPTLPVPQGLEDWLRELLHTELDRRFRRAADAAWSLMQLGDPETAAHKGGETERGVAGATLRQQPTLTGLAETRSDAATPTVVETDSRLPPADTDGAGLGGEGGESSNDSGVAAPPLMSSWEREAPPGRAAIVPRAGLELFSLREIPVVDRREERDRLWEALRGVHRRAQQQVVTLEGEPGVGKSRLAEWLCRRAREIGAASVMRAVHSRASEPGEGLRGMVRETFRTAGLDRIEVYERLLRLLPRLDGDYDTRSADARALTEVLRPSRDAEEIEGPKYRFSSLDQKLALFRRLFRRMARRRPLIVWFDDLQWGREALEVLAELVVDAPILAIATLRADLLADDEALRERLSGIWNRTVTSRIAIDSLSSEDHRALIDRLLDFEPELGETIAERTEGNPMFAIQLVRNWVDRGALEVGEEGFRFAEEAEVEISADIHELWLERLWRLTEGLDAPAAAVWKVLERTALLGRQVDGREWRAVCEELELDGAERIRDGLVERGLAERTDAGWTFAHGLLVASLERRARREGRWRDHHRRCANLLERLYPERSKRTAARRAEHWTEAEEFEPALEALYDEAERARELGEYETAEAVLERRERLFDELDVPKDDVRRVENELKLANFHTVLGSSPESALAAIEDVRNRAKREGYDRIVASAWVKTCTNRRLMGDFAAAREAGRKGAERAKQAGDDLVVITARNQWGWAEVFRGNLAEAEQQFSDARDRAVDIGNRFRELRSKRNLSWAILSLGDHERATRLFEEALEAARDAGYRDIEMRCLNGLGEIARIEGDVEAARERYGRFARIARELRVPGDVANARMNLALVEVMDGRFEVAERRRRQARRGFEATSRLDAVRHLLRLIELATAAGTRDWAQFDDVFDAYETGWPEEARLLTDHPWILEIAGEYAAEAGERNRAERAWRLARELWDRLGDEASREQVADKIDQ